MKLKHAATNGFLIFAAMKKKKYSLENILTNLQIESLNEMQLASLKANTKEEDIVLLSAIGS